MEKRSMYPMFVDLTGKPVLVVGAGKIAGRKVDSLLESGAEITVVSPEADEHLTKLGESGVIKLVSGCFDERYLDDKWLVIAATDDCKVNKMVFDCCEERRIFCNVVDVPEYCRFHVPARVQRGGLQIAVSTSGKSPALAKKIKKELADQYGPEYENLLEVLDYIRNRIKELKPICQCSRAELNQKVLESPKLDSLKIENTDGIEYFINRLLTQAER